MDLMPNADEEQIVEAALSLLSTELAVEYVRWEAGPGSAPDRKLMPKFAELGWIALGLPEDRGGFGFGSTEEALLFREVGRALVTPRLLASVLAARLASMTDPERAQRLISGSSQAGLAVDGGAGDLFLIDADDVDEVVIVDARGPALVPALSLQSRERQRSMDETVTLERASLDPDASLIRGSDGDAAHVSLLISAMLVGSAEAVRDLTVAHASERVQFGQKIGTFQAVSHPIADMAVRCEAALSQMKVAAIAFRDGRDDAAMQVTCARIVAMDAALANAQSAVQLHGGMGFTAEYPIHFHLKRAHLLDQFGGTLADQLDRCFADAA